MWPNLAIAFVSTGAGAALVLAVWREAKRSLSTLTAVPLPTAWVIRVGSTGIAALGLLIAVAVWSTGRAYLVPSALFGGILAAEIVLITQVDRAVGLQERRDRGVAVFEREQVVAQIQHVSRGAGVRRPKRLALRLQRLLIRLVVGR